MSLTTTTDLDKQASEHCVQEAIIGALDYGCWLWFHCTDSRHSRGTPGLPDLICVHRKTGRSMWIEVKKWNGRLTPRQEEWRESLLTGGHDHRVVQGPADLDDLVADLIAERTRRPDGIPEGWIG